MATLIRRPSGAHVIQWIDPTTRQRRTLSIGAADARKAEKIKNHVDELTAAKTMGVSVDSTTAAWVRDLPDAFHARLAAAGLLEPRVVVADVPVRLCEMFDDYVARQVDWTVGTRTNWGLLRKDLVKHFGEDRDARSITAQQAEAFDRWLRVERELAPATASKKSKNARQLFQDAADAKLIPENPFAGVVCGEQVNDERQDYVTVPTILRVMEACPDDEWRAILALSRFGGLRCPSEVLALTWDAIDWDGGKVRVPSIKTARYGKSSRVIPLFEDLRPHLERIRESEGRVIRNYRGSETNLRSRLMDIIKRAGVQPWPRCFQNLRASLTTDLIDKGFPDHVVAQWAGHSKTTAKKHYWMAHAAHHAAAIGQPRPAAPEGAAQGAAQGAARSDGNGSQLAEEIEVKIRTLLGNTAESTALCRLVRELATCRLTPLGSCESPVLPGFFHALKHAKAELKLFVSQ